MRTFGFESAGSKRQMENDLKQQLTEFSSYLVWLLIEKSILKQRAEEFFFRFDEVIRELDELSECNPSKTNR